MDLGKAITSIIAHHLGFEIHAGDGFGVSGSLDASDGYAGIGFVWGDFVGADLTGETTLFDYSSGDATGIVVQFNASASLQELGYALSFYGINVPVAGSGTVYFSISNFGSWEIQAVGTMGEGYSGGVTVGYRKTF